MNRVHDSEFLGNDGRPVPVEYVSTTIIEHGKVSGAVVTLFLALTAVHVAQSLVSRNPDSIDESYLQGLGLAQRLDTWKALVYRVRVMNDVATRLAPEAAVEEPAKTAIEADLIGQLYKQAYPLSFGFPLATFVIAYFLFGQVPLPWLGSWCLAITLISVVRFLLSRAFERAGPVVADPGAWTRRYVLLEVAAGVTVGMSGAFFPFLTSGYQALLLFVVAAQHAGGATLLAPRLRVYLGFFLPSSLLVMFWLFLCGEELRAFVMLMPIYMLLMFSVARRLNDALARAYQLQHKNSGLLASVMGLNDALTRARDQTQAANKELTRLNQSLEQRVQERTLVIRREMEQRVSTEQALRRSHSSYRYLVDNLPQRLFHKDLDGVYVSCNRRYAQDLGIEPDEIVGSTDFDYFPDQLARDYQADDKRIIRGGVTEELEESYLVDGEQRWVNTVRTPLFDDYGEVIGVLGIFWDITEQKRDAEARRRLEHRMHHLQKLEAVGRLAAGIAHEVNTPTQFIGDNVRFLHDAFVDLQSLLQAQGRVLQAAEHNGELGDLLQRARDQEREIDLPELQREIPRAIDQSLDGIGRITDIVGAMKEYSHPGSGHREPTDINRALRSTAEVCRNEWKYHAAVRFDLQPDLPAVPVYPGELNQVFLNLMVNAGHAIAALNKPEGEKGLILVQTRLQGGWLEVNISDDGCGMNEEVKERMFEPFYTTKEMGKGSGQGLAIAHSVVVDRHGGRIDVDTAPGQGTRFTIRLPL